MFHIHVVEKMKTDFLVKKQFFKKLSLMRCGKIGKSQRSYMTIWYSACALHVDN
jgi:hypothetical protein